MGLSEDHLVTGTLVFTALMALDAFRQEQRMEILHTCFLETKNLLC